MPSARALALAPAAALLALLAAHLGPGGDAAAEARAREALGRALLEEERRGWRAFLGGPPAAARAARGRGVLLLGGVGKGPSARGNDYTHEALLAIASLRLAGCRLPVELWHDDDGRLPGPHAGALEEAHVIVRDLRKVPGAEDLQGFQLLTLALLHSALEEVLVVDSDNVFIGDPTELFEAAAFTETGAVFWPDWSHILLDNPFWKIVDRVPFPMPCIETGQMMFHRSRHWSSLSLAHYFNERGPEGYYYFSWGDTQMFAFAWLATRAPFHMVATPLGLAGHMGMPAEIFCGHTMLQFHPAEPGKIMFAHRAHKKWSRMRSDSGPVWERMKKGLMLNYTATDGSHSFLPDRSPDHNKAIFPPFCRCDDGRNNSYCYDYADYRQMPLEPVPLRMARLETELLQLRSQLLGAGPHLRGDFLEVWIEWLRVHSP